MDSSLDGILLGKTTKAVVVKYTVSTCEKTVAAYNEGRRFELAAIFTPDTNPRRCLMFFQLDPEGEPIEGLPPPLDEPLMRFPCIVGSLMKSEFCNFGPTAWSSTLTSYRAKFKPPTLQSYSRAGEIEEEKASQASSLERDITSESDLPSDDEDGSNDQESSVVEYEEEVAIVDIALE